MARKQRVYTTRRDFVSMSYRITNAPRGMRPSEAIEALISHIETGEALPRDLRVEWRWRNKPDGELLKDPFQKVVRESRSGFTGLMLRRLERDFDRIRGG